MTVAASQLETRPDDTLATAPPGAAITDLGGRELAGRFAGAMPLDALREAVRAGEIDTVVVAMTDMQGRLQGKRFHAQHFLDEVLEHGTEACAYLLAVDTEMNTVPGYALTSWDYGYGDFVLEPDLATLRPFHGSRVPRWCSRTSAPRRPAGPRRLGRCCGPPGPGRRARLDRTGRHRLEFIVFEE